ncbi:hypothetical protein [Anaerococcus hydrogenalis]|uniref:Uncharacterized protein n=1 Tax=Anaerococcus hydrogenalis TaxID=33029 RepID=A0A2N6UIE3_9FIRM|nr:hypothetical protein [Anaerococcus hydrogenalis]MDK7694738.1 hypothetical protein [Anaerococcus hydrogenalis]MDK7696708.1 hypothetical protein [Anaerococcus hydrogenalis]MDK7707765.1 hypothetical protein [Anaerococcus hydrogenalis]PMC81376.1 hypothetical protein CJ192_04950 [Anaerococcus hydrogenalis]
MKKWQLDRAAYYWAVTFLPTYIEELKKKIEKADDDLVKIGLNIKLDKAEEDLTEISKVYLKLIDG